VINQKIYKNAKPKTSAVEALLVLVQGVDIGGDFEAELAGDGLAGQMFRLFVLLLHENKINKGKKTAVYY
jgi:hypothetical protein